MTNEFPRHVGGGWVETSDGKKHRGWDRALAHQTQLDGPQPAKKPTEVASVTALQRKVVAKASGWERSEWQGAHMPEALRFDRDGVAWLTIERGGERIEVDFVGPSGPYKEPVANIVARNTDFVVTAETRQVAL